MDDVERLFRHLVRLLAADDAERLRTPIEVSELYQSIVPYRSHKHELRFDAIEDYDMAILRLLAGEHGYVSVEPIEVREALVLESEAVNPNPGAFRDFAAATVVLNPGAVRSVLEGQAAYAPPPAPATPAAGGAGGAAAAGVAGGEPVFEAIDLDRSGRAPSEPANTCVHCDAKLPRTRKTVFCPFCGRELQALHCTSCGDPLEPGWRFCLTCGHPARG